MIAAEELLAHAHGKALIGDTGYDSNDFVRAVRKQGMKPVIHSKPEGKKKHRLDRTLYRQRYLVEVFFHRLKRFRAIATRYEKTSRNYLALVQLSCAWLWLSRGQARRAGGRGRFRGGVDERRERPRSRASESGQGPATGPPVS
jgi:transposase